MAQPPTQAPNQAPSRDPREGRSPQPVPRPEDAPLPPPDDPRLHEAHEDAESGRPDTDRGPVMDRLYHRVRKGEPR